MGFQAAFHSLTRLAQIATADITYTRPALYARRDPGIAT